MGLAFSESAKRVSGQYGFHILRVQLNSPAEAAGLQPFFDFIMCINGEDVSSDPNQVQRELSRHLGRPVQLHVYSSKLRSTRRVTLLPRNDWGGQGLLGATVRLCAMAGQPAMAWRVLDVAAGSPAEAARLRPGADYIVGCADTPMHSQEDLFDAVESRAGCPTRLYVYNCLADRCRMVTVTPDPGWGGDGSLGCGIGYGYLHQIPAGCDVEEINGDAGFDHLSGDVASAVEATELNSEPSYAAEPTLNQSGLAAASVSKASTGPIASSQVAVV